MKKLSHIAVLTAKDGVLEVEEIQETLAGDILDAKEDTDIGVAAVQAIQRYWSYSPAAPRSAIYEVRFFGTIVYHPDPSRDDEPYPVITLDTPFPSISYS